MKFPILLATLLASVDASVVHSLQKMVQDDSTVDILNTLTNSMAALDQKVDDLLAFVSLFASLEPDTAKEFTDTVEPTIITDTATWTETGTPSTVTATLCFTTNNPLCGLNVTYTNSKGLSQSVQTSYGGSALGCDWTLFKQHTNAAGFWEDLNLVVNPGLNIGYNPTGASATLGNASSSDTNCATLNDVCFPMFGWNPSYDKLACVPNNPASDILTWFNVKDLY